MGILQLRLRWDTELISELPKGIFGVLFFGEVEVCGVGGEVPGAVFKAGGIGCGGH